ncbi:uncharacterized protein LOC134832207 [Culicoides brevitarsis]|uniref:uncharacterized protein LOC134832207 n=1 Tax=Culicoides brevitarsis TaxID=469753 RepID=UPI00307BC216
MAQKYYDDSGYEVNFEDDIPESERLHYLKVFPTVDKVAERRIHCTSCNSHIGTAPFAEARIRMHPVLKVTHCRNCHSFYNSGEFDKGEDGSELYCRWCGQGGEVYCCSSCPYVFCKKCIVQNFSRSMITEIEKQDNWECFACSPQILFNLRSQHWALVNFIEKQTKEIISANLPSDEHEERMSHDSTTCCRRKTDATKKAPAAASKKRSASPAKAPPAKKPPERVFRASTLLNGGTSAPQIASSRPSQQPTRAAASNLVCAPDILSMFSDADPAPTPISPAAPRIILQTQPTTRRSTASENPPPLAVRQYVGGNVRPTASAQQKQAPVPMVQISHGPRPVAGSFARSGAAGGAPVYHTIQGYRIDLNCAANQETFRLPNGKYIQVKKQPPTLAPLPAARNQLRTSLGQALVNNYGVRYSNPTHPQMQQRLIQVQQPTQVQQVRAPPTGLSLQPPPMTLEKPSHPPTPLGMARNAFEFKVLNTLEVCHQIIGKINTLTNYPSYKTVNHISELKDLYKHLSYLLSYTVGRFKTLQDKCAQETKDLGFDEDTEKTANTPDDELEVVEQQTTVIEIDSDAEQDTETEVQSSSGSTPLRPILEPRPSISSIDSESVAPSISSLIDDLNDPKLRLEPRVEVIRAECLIPSVNQLLKNEVKNATQMIKINVEGEKSDENAQNEEGNDEEEDLMSNLLEVTPDISVMMGTNDDEETVKIPLSDGEDDVVEISDSPCSEKPATPTNEGTEEGEIVGNVEKTKENEVSETNTSKNDDEDVVMLDDDSPDNTLKAQETNELLKKTQKMLRKQFLRIKMMKVRKLCKLMRLL